MEKTLGKFRTVSISKQTALSNAEIKLCEETIPKECTPDEDLKLTNIVNVEENLNKIDKNRDNDSNEKEPIPEEEDKQLDDNENVQNLNISHIHIEIK